MLIYLSGPTVDFTKSFYDKNLHSKRSVGLWYKLHLRLAHHKIFERFCVHTIPSCSEHHFKFIQSQRTNSLPEGILEVYRAPPVVDVWLDICRYKRPSAHFMS